MGLQAGPWAEPALPVTPGREAREAGQLGALLVMGDFSGLQKGDLRAEHRRAVQRAVEHVAGDTRAGLMLGC